SSPGSYHRRKNGVDGRPLPLKPSMLYLPSWSHPRSFALATIRPFAGIRFGRQFNDVSNLIAPPYDVLDEAHKAALQAKHPNNIVTVDAPWMPPKTVGPDEVYEKASVTLAAWRSGGVLVQDQRRALYPYNQTFEYGGKT